MYMNSPVLAVECLWGLSHRNKGQFFGLDPKTGKTVWTGEGRQAENAAMVARGETVFALTTNSELLVFRATPKALQLVRTYQRRGHADLGASGNSGYPRSRQGCKLARSLERRVMAYSYGDGFTDVRCHVPRSNRRSSRNTLLRLFSGRYPQAISRL